MPSIARYAFDKNVEDIDQLLKLHADKGGNEKGRRFGLEVLNKSAIVLITAYWEAYCEDIAAEALLHIIDDAASADKLPCELKKLIAKELKNDKHELAIWQLSDNGWRDIIKARLDKLQEERNRRLNTPKSDQIDELFRVAVGIPTMLNRLEVPKIMTVTRAKAKLDRFVTLRGAIAHRGSSATSVKKSQVTDYFEFIKRLAGKTGGRVKSHVKAITGRNLW